MMRSLLLNVFTLSTLLSLGACKAPAPEAATNSPAKAVKIDDTLPAPKSTHESSAKLSTQKPPPKGSREEKAEQVRKVYAEKGMLPAVKEYRTLMKSTLAEAAFFVDLERELKGDPSLEAVRKAVMSEKPEIALSEAMRVSKDKAAAQKKVDDFKVILIPVTLEHARDIQKRDKRSALSMANRLFPNTPIWELEAKLN